MNEQIIDSKADNRAFNEIIEDYKYKDTRQVADYVVEPGKVTISFGPKTELNELAFLLLHSIWPAVWKAFVLLHDQPKSGDEGS